MDLSALDLIPDNRRGFLEYWLTHCRDEDTNEDELRGFWHIETTPQEVRAFVSPFECADDLYKRIMLVHGPLLDPVDENTLLAAVREYVRELARNGRHAGETTDAARVEDVESYRIVDSAEFARRTKAAQQAEGDSELRIYLEDPIWDAAADDVFAHPDSAASSLMMALHTWYLPIDVEFFILQPFLRDGLVFDAACRLWSMGCETLVTTEAVFIRYTPRNPVPARPIPPATRGSAAKAAARTGVDWFDFPMSQLDIAALRAVGDTGDHPSLAKLSLMQMAGMGVPYDLPGAFGLLERAAGDFPSVLGCYQAGQEMNLAAARYGMYYLATMGWGVPKSKEDAAEHLKAAAENGFPHAMYLLGMNLRSGTIEEVRQAERWLTRAAASGYHEAYRMLFHIFDEGELADARKAFFWLKRAANEHASTGYQLWLGEAYEKGEITARDDVQAFKWYYLAARQSSAPAPRRDEQIERLRLTMSDTDVQEATTQALAWIEHNDGKLGSFESSGLLFTNPATLS